MGTNGAAPTNYDQLLAAQFEVATGGDVGAFIMARRSFTKYAKLKETTNQPLERPRRLRTTRS